MAGIGPVPLAALMLAEYGARVIRVERLRAGAGFLPLAPDVDLSLHGRTTLKVDLKRPEGVDLMLRLVAAADILVEGFRPGVMERLGLGPQPCLARNPRLVYGRMTGFGQDGPLADRAGHDLTYLALTGALHAIGPKGGRPAIPLNLVADYGGGTMFLVAGILAALVSRATTGRGQVVDAAMVDGASMLLAPTFSYMASGFWKDSRGVNLLDGGAPFYDVYEAADGRHVAVACLEPQFFAEFVRLLPLDAGYVARQYDPRAWPELRAAITARIAERPRDAWAELFEPSDACVAPVLSLAEAAEHPHNRARDVHARVGRMTRPRPAPRFSATPASLAGPPAAPADLAALLAGFGIDPDEARALASNAVVGA
ncbi:MAG TPA: CoA transferase [Rhizobiales bacterium]|nr:CoA transferase [Hyphomicrobiales bacterium]